MLADVEAPEEYGTAANEVPNEAAETQTSSVGGSADTVSCSSAVDEPASEARPEILEARTESHATSKPDNIESTNASSVQVELATSKSDIEHAHAFEVEVTCKGGGTATLFSSIVNMTNTILGVGLLALPRVLAHGGLGMGLLLNTFCCVLNIFTNHLLAECQRRVGRPATFKTIADQAMPYYSIVIDLGVVVNCIGGGCSYVIVASASFQYVANQFGPRWYWTMLTLLLVSPISFFRSLDSLRHTSLVAVLLLLFIMLVIALFASGTGAAALDPCPPGIDEPSCPPGAISATMPPASTLSAFSSLTLAYQCQMSTPTIGNELANPTRKRMLIVFVCSLGLAWTMYSIVAICGYTTYGDHVTGNILNSYPDTPLISVARIGLAFVVIFSYPIMVFVARLSVRSLVEVVEKIRGGRRRTRPEIEALGRSERPKSNLLDSRAKSYLCGSYLQSRLPLMELETQPAVITCLFILCTIIVGLTVSDLGLVVDLAGATGATTIALISPGFMYYCIFSEQGHSPLRIGSALVAIFGVIMFIVGVILAIVNAVDRIPNDHGRHELPSRGNLSIG